MNDAEGKRLGYGRNAKQDWVKPKRDRSPRHEPGHERDAIHFRVQLDIRSRTQIAATFDHDAIKNSVSEKAPKQDKRI